LTVSPMSMGDRCAPARRLRAAPFVCRRLPKMFNLRLDRYERADITSNTHTAGEGSDNIRSGGHRDGRRRYRRRMGWCSSRAEHVLVLLRPEPAARVLGLLPIAQVG
jgi:hypothetical protein